MQWPIEFDEEDFSLFKNEWKLAGGRADSFMATAPYNGEECWGLSECPSEGPRHPFRHDMGRG